VPQWCAVDHGNRLVAPKEQEPALAGELQALCHCLAAERRVVAHLLKVQGQLHEFHHLGTDMARQVGRADQNQCGVLGAVDAGEIRLSVELAVQEVLQVAHVLGVEGRVFLNLDHLVQA